MILSYDSRGGGYHGLPGPCSRPPRTTAPLATAKPPSRQPASKPPGDLPSPRGFLFAVFYFFFTLLLTLNLGDCLTAVHPQTLSHKKTIDLFSLTLVAYFFFFPKGLRLNWKPTHPPGPTPFLANFLLARGQFLEVNFGSNFGSKDARVPKHA